MPAAGDVVEAQSGAADSWPLVVRVQAGDREAFGLIYNRYHPVVFRYVRRRVHGHQLAEDLAADTFVRALKRIGSFTWQGRDLGAWLLTIAHNLVADHFKSGRYRLEVVTYDVLEVDRPDGADSPEAVVVSRLTDEGLVEGLKQLGVEQRQCLALRFLEQMSIAETAAAMGRSESAIKALQFRAVRALRVVDLSSRGRDVMASPIAPAINGADLPNIARPPSTTIESLLVAAARIDHPRVTRQAERVREAVAVLKELVEGHGKRAEAEERVARLRQQLATAEAELRNTGARPVSRSAPRASVISASSAEVRAWAAANGVECSPRGIVSARVLDAYRKAMRDAS